MAFFQSIFKNPYHSFRYVPKPISFGSSPAPPLDDALVAAAVSILKHQRSKSRWSHLRSLLTADESNRLSPSQFSEIALQLRNKPQIALGFFRFTIDHSLSSHSLASYATVIHILSRSRLRYHALTLIKSAMCVFCELQQRNKPTPIAILEALAATYRACDSAPFVFDLLVDACLESKKIDSALEIYAILKSRNVFLRTCTCNSLIELVSRSRGCFAGFDLYREIFRCDGDGIGKKGKRDKRVLLDTNTMNVVMVGFYREGLVDKVKEVWEELVGFGCVPNLYSFNVLMATYCDAGRMDDAMRVWDEVGNRGLKHDVVAYNTVIGGFCGVGEVGRAEEVYREMVMNGLESTCITFENLINGYCKIGDFDSVKMVYKDMCRKNFSPTNSTVNVIISSLCRTKESLAALEFWRNAAKKHEAVLEKENYKKLTRGLCEEGMMEEALQCQAEMAGKGFEPNLEIYNAFIDGYIRRGDEAIASTLREEMLCKQRSQKLATI